MAARSRFPPTVWALGAVSFFSDLGGEMVFPLLPALLAGMGGAAWVGTVEGVSDAVQYLVKPWFGARSDRIRKRKGFVLLGYGLAAAAKPALALTGSVAAATAARSSDRLGKGIRDAPRDALIAHAAPEGRLSSAFSLNRAFDNAGAVAGPLLATLLVSLGLSVRSILALAALPGILTLLTIAFFVRDHEPGSAGKEAPARSDEPLPRSLKLFLGILFLFALGNSTDALLLVRAGALGLRPGQVTLAYALLSASKTATNYLGGSLADRFGAVKTILPGWAIYAAAYLGFALAPSAGWVWPLFALYGVYYGLAEGPEKGVVSKLAPAGAKGRALGFFGLAYGGGTLLASIGTQLLYTHVGPGWAFGVGAAFAGVAALALVLWGTLGGSATRGA